MLASRWWSGFGISFGVLPARPGWCWLHRDVGDDVRRLAQFAAVSIGTGAAAPRLPAAALLPARRVRSASRSRLAGRLGGGGSRSTAHGGRVAGARLEGDGR
jgi:hypothetical protein